jgi:hypothetical protein|tara:strand:+ start:204 stop:332 length:129 start_codon:yes stop_codon:yes gene_type:complete
MSDELEDWSQKHFAEMAFWRTVAAGVNIFLTCLVLLKLFEVI